MERKEIFDVLRYNKAFPGASRMVLRGFSSGLCFSIAALCRRHISQERSGKPVDDVPIDESSATGNEIDAANDQTDAADGRELEQATREEQGFSVADEPLVVAGYLKGIYSWVAGELLEHAARRKMPDDTIVPDEYHLASTMQNALKFSTTAPARYDKATIQAKSKMYGIPEAELEAPIIARQKRQNEATARDAGRVVELFDELVGKGTDGHELEAEACFDRLHPLYQVRVLVSLDKALYNAYKNCVVDDVKSSRPDAAADAFHINGMRWEVRKVHTHLQKDERFKREYEDALGRVPNAPVWAPEPLKVIEQPQRKAA